jgi:hypothetical protein
LLSGCLALLTLASLSLVQAGEKKSASFEVKDAAVRVSGPYAHENLTVFLLHGKDQDDRDYLTLDQGLDNKLVAISEKKQAQVGELQIENKSDRYLFLQEGDRLQGGQQDRIIITSLVIPPRSGMLPVPSFCIEQSRWQGGYAFSSTGNKALADKGVRAAAKVTPGRGGQRAVWERVAQQKAIANSRLGSANTTSSLNEAFESPQVRKLCDACAKALNDLVEKHKDALGVAVVVNGNIEEVDIYPNHRLLVRLYPRLVQSYAVQAALEKKGRKKSAEPAAADVEKFMRARKEKARRFERIDRDNSLRVRDLAGRVVECVTAYKGEPVHRQWIDNYVREAPREEAPRQNAPRDGKK